MKLILFVGSCCHCPWMVFLRPYTSLNGSTHVQQLWALLFAHWHDLSTPLLSNQMQGDQHNFSQSHYFYCSVLVSQREMNFIVWILGIPFAHCPWPEPVLFLCHKPCWLIEDLSLYPAQHLSTLLRQQLFEYY